MKAKRYLLIGLLLGSIAGWTLGFLRLPYLEKNTSFGVGFLSCLAMGLIGWLLLFVWKKNAWLLKNIKQEPATKGGSNVPPTYTLLWVLVAAFIALGGALSSILIFRQNKFYKIQAQQQNEQLAQQSALLEASRNSNLIVLMNQLSDQIAEELNNNPGRSLREETITRIAALNHSFRPYRYLKGDSLSEKKLSPERGQLLILLATLNMDSSSFNSLKRQVSFSGADLEKADLNGIDLRGADLSQANLKEAELNGADLSQANLEGANLWGSNLRNVNLRQANLQNTDFGWANVIGADLRKADLNGASFVAAKLTKADLSRASVTWANLREAFLNEAKLIETDLTWTNLSGANFSEAVLKNAVMRVTNLMDINFNQTDLEGVDLTGSIIREKNWMEKLDRWKVNGADRIREEFDIVVDKSGLYDYRIGKAAN